MTRLRYRLQPDGRELEVWWGGGQGVTLWLHGRIITQIDEPTRLEEGAKVSLPDGSFVRVWLKHGKLTLSQDDKLLISADEWSIKHAFLFGFLTAGVNLYTGLAGLGESPPPDMAVSVAVLNKMFGVVFGGVALRASLRDFLTQPTATGTLNLIYAAVLLGAGLFWVLRKSPSALLVGLTAVMLVSTASLMRLTVPPQAEAAEVVLVLFLMLLFRFVCLVGILDALRTLSRAGRMAPNSA